MRADGRKKLITVEPGVEVLLLSELLAGVGEAIAQRRKSWHQDPIVRGNAAGQVIVYADEGLRRS